MIWLFCQFYLWLLAQIKRTDNTWHVTVMVAISEGCPFSPIVEWHIMMVSRGLDVFWLSTSDIWQVYLLCISLILDVLRKTSWWCNIYGCTLTWYTWYIESYHYKTGDNKMHAWYMTVCLLFNTGCIKYHCDLWLDILKMQIFLVVL